VSAVQVVFLVLSLIAVVSALLVVTTSHLVHSALWLVVTLGAVAGIYLVLTAELVAWVQVLIYVGAVVVLLLFGLMLTRAPIGISADLDAPPMQRVAAAVVALGLAAIIVVASVDAFRGEDIELSSDDVGGSSTAAGEALFRSWVLPFEVLSVLLLAALVGAIVLSRRDIGGAGEPEDGR
jgi:NADH-quinone oxidoreductase subunit J